MKIAVTAEHIASAKLFHTLYPAIAEPAIPEDIRDATDAEWHLIKSHLVYSCHCPVALALRDAGFNMPVVMATKVTLDTSDWREADLPKSAQRFIRQYDSSKDVKPFNFMLKGVTPPHATPEEADVATG